ncbi:fibronectin type III domain-containing protein [Candidatus Epulonipiscium viviparus]|uniref:fibronectin type III domain-containing protein n=1 Tax=Candidatus Epulonipiscium viviparus TaxID=420336 RepID=UPI00049790DF|nr:fibronectin type III domain-containing protein [Candidatus Epulopiscium viviparus]
MKTKRITAFMLASVMVISLFPINIFANIQNPPTDLYANITHKKNGEFTIVPDVLFGWTRPEIAADKDGDASGSDPAIDVEGSHDLTGYELTTEDFMGTSPGRDMPIGPDTTEQDISVLLESGVFYQINLVARHLHTVVDEATDEKYDSIIESELTSIKIITDLNTQVTGTDEGLEVVFEYIPNIQYTLGYTQGAAGDIGDFPENSDITLKATDLTQDNIFTDPNDGRQYVRYLISEGVSPGQMYSVYVMPDFSEGDPLREQTTIGLDPKVVSAITSIPLKVFNVGNGKIRLEWNISASILENSYSLTKTSIMAQVAGQNPQEIFTFQDNNGALIGYYELYEPEATTVYWLEFEFTDLSTNNTLAPPPTTGKVEYIPYDAVEKPSSPQIPKPFNTGIDLNANIASEYLVKGDTTPYNAENFANQTFTVINNAPVQIQLVWDAYEAAALDGNKTFDYDLVYDIWITERKESLDSSLLENGLAPIERNILIDPDDESTLVKTPFGDLVGFKKTVAQYYDVEEILRPLATNKTYYIQIVAKRQDGARYAISEPTIVAITIDKNGDIFIPPVLVKPPVMVKDDSITTTTADIIWRTEWQEMMYKGSAKAEDFYKGYEENIPFTDQWNSKVFLAETDPKIFFKQPSSLEIFPIDLITPNNVEMVKDFVGANFYENNFTSRPVTLGNNIKYEIQTLPYETVKNMQGSLSLEEWVYMTEIEGGNADWNAGWEEPVIRPYQDDLGLTWNEHKLEDLLPNTAYITFVRAYRLLDDGTKLIQSYPSFIIYNTLANFTSEEEVPIVPNLTLNEVTDSSIEVFFKFNHKFDYELVYSRLDDPDGPDAVSFLFDLSSDANSEFYVGDGENAYIEVTGLFPDTEYYIWVRAKQKEGDLKSSWSSPVFAKTKQILPPDVPISLGPASKLSLIELDLEYDPITHNYVTVQWEKDENDFGESTEGNVVTTYAYTVEFADNVEFIDATVVTITEENKTEAGADEDPFQILAKNMIKFNNLKSNKDYFVKVKSIITVLDGETDRTLEEESEYSNWVRIVTKTSKDEYTGEPDNVIEFETDYEEDFDQDSGVWNYTIVNPEGIITQLINTDSDTFDVDLNLFDGIENPVVRKLTVPVMLLTAMDSLGINLQIETNDVIYNINPAGINLSNLKSTDNAVFTFVKVLNYDLNDMQLDYPHAFQVAEQVAIHLVTDTMVPQSVSTLSKDMNVSIKLNAYSPLNLVSRVYNAAQQIWEDMPAQTIVAEDGAHSTFDTNLIGINALYSTRNVALPRDLTQSLRDITAKYGITQFGLKYFGNTPVNSTAFINLMLGIAYANTTIDLDKSVSDSEISQATHSGLFTESQTSEISNEAAIAGLIKLYELKNGYSILTITPQTNFEGASKQYSASLSKAYALGIIDESTFEPLEPATYDYICDLLVNLGL